MGSIRTSLSFLIASTAIVTLLAAAGILMAVRTTDQVVQRLTVAQRRLDLLAEISGHLTDYAFSAVDDVAASTPDHTRLATLRATLEVLMTSADTGDDPATRANPRRPIALLRSDFQNLDTAIAAGLSEADVKTRGDTIRGALNSFALASAPELSAMVEAERQAVLRGREDMARTLSRLSWIAAIAAILAIIVAFLLHRAITRPLLRRIGVIDAAARAIGHGKLDTRLPIAGHDELGLLVARFNRMAASLARREASLSEDRAALGRTVTEKTAELTAANQRLASVDRSRRRFFADVSHELRTPLTVVLGECDVTLRAPAISEAQSRMVLTTIRHRALRLHRRVEDMLRVARSETGEISLNFRRVNLRRVLEDTVEGFAAVARRHNLAVELVPPVCDGDVVADSEWIRQVIEGLIDNAVQHAKGATTIRVSMDEDADSVLIMVADDGIGIPEAVRAQVFERFARRDEGESSGFGIGLALAQWVISRHRGQIDIVSHINAGTRVEIVLPKAATGDENMGYLR